MHGGPSERVQKKENTPKRDKALEDEVHQNRLPTPKVERSEDGFSEGNVIKCRFV